MQTLQQWEQALLQGATFYKSPYEILHKISVLPASSELLLVSDGSLRNTSVTFGWVFGTDDGQILIEQLAWGCGQPTSHRAEGWGMLSSVLFLQHLLSRSEQLLQVLTSLWPLEGYTSRQPIVPPRQPSPLEHHLGWHWFPPRWNHCTRCLRMICTKSI
jgi:hypothetical protein